VLSDRTLCMRNTAHQFVHASGHRSRRRRRRRADQMLSLGLPHHWHRVSPCSFYLCPSIHVRRSFHNRSQSPTREHGRRRMPHVRMMRSTFGRSSVITACSVSKRICPMHTTSWLSTLVRSSALSPANATLAMRRVNCQIRMSVCKELHSSTPLHAPLDLPLISLCPLPPRRWHPFF
jgi:hypothetical protein